MKVWKIFQCHFSGCCFYHVKVVTSPIFELCYFYIYPRSFKPILRILMCDDAPAAQHWGMWALTNLTKVYRKFAIVLYMFWTLGINQFYWNSFDFKDCSRFEHWE